jgi:aspartate-semialdehyde dehydrogenase
LAEVKKQPLIAVVGGDSLIAREIREVLEGAEPAARLQLISNTQEDSMMLAPDEEEVMVMAPLNAESLAGAQVAILAGSQALSRKAVKTASEIGVKVIDLTGALEERPQARLRAPMAEPLPPSGGEDSVQIIAHPAAIALAMFLAALARPGKLRRTLVHIFEPASERGKKGLEELQQQTIAVLNFQKLKTDVFDTQVSFSLLPKYGVEAMEPLESIEERLERHLASLLAAWPGIPMPSLRLVQAPVFHGYSFSVWAEFEDPVKAEMLESMLESAEIDVRREDPPSNVGAVGQSGLSVGAVNVDRNNPRACWFWMVTDNLRLAAENAVAVARELL